ncbi:MAG: hypothetical protein WC196_04515 [Bacilli bacterium]|jgi:hypothetical protein
MRANYFDMLSRTVGEPLPDCAFFEYYDNDWHKIEFYGTLDELSEIPIRLDIAVEERMLVGDATQVEIRKNCTHYIAEYKAYAIHVFEDEIPS